MQVSLRRGATERNSAGETLPSCQGSPGMGLGAIAPGWTGRLDLAARDEEQIVSSQESREHAQLCLGFLGATKKSALQQDPDGKRRLRTQGPGNKKFQKALTENKVGRRKKEKTGHTSGKDQARWSTPLTSTNSHSAPRSRVSVTDFAVVSLTCAKAGQHLGPSSAVLQWPLLAPQTQRAACGV